MNTLACTAVRIGMHGVAPVQHQTNQPVVQSKALEGTLNAPALHTSRRLESVRQTIPYK